MQREKMKQNLMLLLLTAIVIIGSLLHLQQSFIQNKKLHSEKVIIENAVLIGDCSFPDCYSWSRHNNSDPSSSLQPKDTDVVISICREQLTNILNEITRYPRVSRVFIYSKCGQNVPSFRLNSIPVIFKTLPNLGREGHSYLHHILYSDKFENYTMFLQAKPHEHFFPGHSVSLFFTDAESYYPISGQLLLVDGAQFHRIRDGFRPLYVCHGGNLTDKYNWTQINYERKEQLLLPDCYWGNEDIYSWNTDFCSQHSTDVAFIGGGPWRCNLVPLSMPWNSFQKNMSVRASILRTWRSIIPGQKMPRALYYSLGGQFTLSRNIIKSPSLVNRFKSAYRLLSSSDNPVEGYHMELLWGYLFALDSVVNAKFDFSTIFNCTDNCILGKT